MPKETVKAMVPPYDVKVGWSRDGDVQVGVEERDGRSLLWQIFGTPENRHRILKGLGEMGLLHAEGIPVTPNAQGDELVNALFNLIESGEDCKYTYAGVWATLDRTECNELIRLVRKARDQAFGRDE